MEINWQLGLIRSILKLRPHKVIVLYHAGKINHNLMLLLLQIMGVPYVLWGSGSGDRRKDFSKLQRRLKGIFKFLFIRNSSGYLCYSTQFAEELEAQGYDSDRIIVAQNTLNVEAIYNNLEGEMESKVDGCVKFLFVGVIFRGKRLDAAIQVCKQLRDKGLDFTFEIVGSGDDLVELKQLVSSLGIEDIVSLPGAQYGENLKRRFRQADVFLLPGTGGLAVNEAMAYGLPIITTPGDGTAYDLVQNGVNGYILDFDYRLSELEERMKFFIDSDSAKLKEMGSKSIEIIKDKASLTNMVNQFTKVFNW